MTDEKFSSDTGGNLSKFILETVHELEEAETGYTYARRGQVMITAVEAGYHPKDVSQEITKQVEKGRLYKPRKFRLGRI